MTRSFIVVLARGLNVGLIPIAPGTFGSILGFAWAALLLSAGSLVWIGVGTVAGLGIAICICGQAEQILQQKDPGSIVLDEIAAYPLCYAGWVIWSALAGTGFPGNGAFWIIPWWKHLLVFATFRFFDVVKPWPVRSSQKLPGGWGVVMDDVLAALYTALLSLVAELIF